MARAETIALVIGDDSKNCRRAERVAINSEFGRGVTTFVSDLSERGVFLHTTEKVEMGTKVELRFTVLLDDPVTVEAIGTVMRQQDDPPGVGVQFGPLSPAMVLRINDAISRMRPRDLGPPLSPSGGARRRKPFIPPPPMPARASAEVLTEEGFQEAKTGAFRSVSVDQGRTVEMAGGRPAAEPSHEDAEEAKTLFKLKPVDVEILDEDEPEDED